MKQVKAFEGNFSAIPRINYLLKTSPTFEANQMKWYATRAMLNSLTPVNTMGMDELIAFEDELVRVFKFHNWIK